MVSQNYIYNILNGDRKNPSREKIIAISIAATMNFEEINRALKIGKEGVLYAKDPRDVIIATCVNNGIRNVMEVNEILYEKSYEPLK